MNYYPMKYNGPFTMNLFVVNNTTHFLKYVDSYVKEGKLTIIGPKEVLPRGTAKFIVKAKKYLGEYAINTEFYYRLQENLLMERYEDTLIKIRVSIHGKLFFVGPRFVTHAGRDYDPNLKYRMVYDKMDMDDIKNVHVIIEERNLQYNMF